MESLLEHGSKVEVRTHLLSTNLHTVYEVSKIEPYFNSHEAVLRWSVDLHDWERVLKVLSTTDLDLDEIFDILSLEGFLGKELSD